jgi:hypothetical protein
LTPGDYRVFVTARNTNNNSVFGMNIYFATRATGTSDFVWSGTPETISNGDTNTAFWDQGVEYAAKTLTVGANEDLIIVSQALATSGDLRPFLNTIEIVAVPEPAGISLAGIAVAAALGMRRRRPQ